MLVANTARKHFVSKAATNASGFDVSLIANETLRRQLTVIGIVSAKLDENSTLLISQLTNQMQRIYATAKICAWEPVFGPNCSSKWSLDPDLMTILAETRNYDLQAYIWHAWRNATGRRIRHLYKNFMELSNQGAKAAGYKHLGDLWSFYFEDNMFLRDVDEIWKELLPLYEQLHAYVRYHLRNFYDGRFNTSAIPAHILGENVGSRILIQ